jgi:DHA2 family multidrug resistance protein-like MFS transporter
MALLLAVGPVLLPEYRDPAAGLPDLMSAALSLAAVLPVIYGIKRMAESGPAWLPAAAVAAGLMVGVAFVRRQRALADPLIDLRLFRSPRFSAPLVVYTFATFVAFGAYLFIAQYLQLVLGLSPLRAGVAMVPFFLGFIAGSMLAPPMARRIRPAFVMAGGLVLAAIGFGLLSRIDGSSGLALVVVGCVAYSLGLAPAFTLTTDLIVGSAPPERAGVASAMSETGSELGGALGIAVLGSIGTAMYGGMSAGPGAGDAVARSLALNGAICAVMALLMAAGTAILLRNVRPAS